MDLNKKVYYDEVNIYRALIMFWVILGHAFDEGTDFFGFLHGYAYTFHMPALFAISGFLIAPKLHRAKGIKSKFAAILDRAKRLLVPFYFFSAVSVLLKIIFDRYANNPFAEDYSVLDFILGLKNPNGGLWFLQVLMIISVVFIILSDLPDIAVFIIAVSLRVALIFLSSNIWLLNTCMYAVYMSAGILLRNYYPTITKRLDSFSKKHFASGAVTAVLLAASFALLPFFEKMGYLGLLYRVLNMIVWFMLALVINEYTKLKKPFMVIGDYSMDIYMLGYYVQIALRVVLMQILGLPALVCAPLMLVCGLLLPIPISKFIIRKFKLTSAVMLGIFPKKVK